MADIVERLRGLADVFEAQQAPHNLVLHMRAGADEIERLRAGGCARDQGTTQYCAEAAKKDAEIARLLNLLADARTESMKLRAALRSLVSYTQCHYVDGYCVQHSSPDPCEMAEARAALEGK